MGSEGDTLAFEASDLTGYRLILASTIGKLARRHALNGSEWRWLDQGWSRLFARLEDGPEIRLAVLRPVLLEVCAARRGALFLGRGIAELLQDSVPLFRVHVGAPFQVRAERIMQQVNITRSRAEERVRRSDAENAWFYRYFFRVDWKDRARHDLIIDTSTSSSGEASARIAGAVSEFQVAVSTGQGRLGSGEDSPI
jgi:cytidylate kinase